MSNWKWMHGFVYLNVNIRNQRPEYIYLDVQT